MTRAEIAAKIRKESSVIATFSERLQKLLEQACESETADLAKYLKIASSVRNDVGLATHAIYDVQIAARKVGVMSEALTLSEAVAIISVANENLSEGATAYAELLTAYTEHPEAGDQAEFLRASTKVRDSFVFQVGMIVAAIQSIQPLQIEVTN